MWGGADDYAPRDVRATPVPYHGAGACRTAAVSERRQGTRPPLRLWHVPAARARHVVCIGDSITYAPSMPRIGVDRNWVDQVAAALDETTGARPGNGFHGLWRDEWRRAGAWTQPTTADAFDVGPFRQAAYSSGRTTDQMTWTKPAAMTVGAFEIYAFSMPGVGRWQYRVDAEPWRNVSATSGNADKVLRRIFVDEPVHAHVDIRGHDGAKPCVAAIAGITSWTSATPDATGTVVHNLGHQHQMLAAFCRPSAGDPLALLDDIRPDLITVLFSNDVRLQDPPTFGETLRHVIRRVGPYADVLLISPFEQRPPRRVADAVTEVGSRVITSETALFLVTDARSRVSGTNIPEGATIASVQSTQSATMTVAATGSSGAGELAVKGRRHAATQAEYRAVTKEVAGSTGCMLLDLYDEWTSTVGAGWDAAWAAGFMHDSLHPTQLGHDDIATRVSAALGLSTVTPRQAHQ
jgi:lysophospholipase L1-like esterase